MCGGMREGVGGGHGGMRRSPMNMGRREVSYAKGGM